MEGYEIISYINEEHRISIVRETATGRELICKELSVYNKDIYEFIAGKNIPGLPKIVRITEKDNILTVIEEKIQGEDLQKKLTGNKVFTRGEILNIAISLCEILKNILPVIHRDIKPSNVILTDKNEVYLIDLNAGKFFKPDTIHDSDTSLLGTPGFAAPEQYGFGESTPKTDIYGLGILIKKLLNNIESGTYTDDISLIAKKCCEINPNDRYDSIGEVRKELSKAIKTKTDSTWHKFSKTPVGRLALPGYRKGKLSHILIATPCYLLMLYIATHLNIEDNSGNLVYAYRIVFGLMMFSTVLCTFNYLNIHRIFPLCSSKNLFLKALGILMVNLMLYAIFFTALVIAAQFLL